MRRTLKTLFALLFALSFLLLQFFAPFDVVCVEIVAGRCRRYRRYRRYRRHPRRRRYQHRFICTSTLAHPFFGRFPFTSVDIASHKQQRYFNLPPPPLPPPNKKKII